MHAPSASPINIEALDAQTGGDRALARELFEILEQDASPQLARIRGALSTGECLEVRAAAHRLRGALLALGAPAAAEAAGMLEKQAVLSEQSGSCCCDASVIDTLESEILRSIEFGKQL
jgi:HPt (histidine-containing phosphotransfer) domain-containing protein